MSLAWTGPIIAPSRRLPRDLPVRDPIIALDRGALLGWFNMGSTVIVMFPAGGPALVGGLVPDRAVRVGERLASQR